MENLNFFYQDIGTSSSAGGHLTQEEAAKEELAIRMSRKFTLLEEERPIIETMAYHDKYKKILDEVWKDKVELDGKIVKEDEEAVKRIKRGHDRDSTNSFKSGIPTYDVVTMGTHDDEAGSSRSKRFKDNVKPMDCDGEIGDMLRIRLREARSDEEIFTSVAWIRAFNINKPFYAELCHEFYSTYKFDEVCVDDELQTKKIIKFRLGGRAHSLALMGRMEIRQEAIERMEYSQSYHYDSNYEVLDEDYQKENGNSFIPAAQTTTNADGTSTSLIPGPVTTEEKAQKKNDVKVRSMLLMALPNEYLMTFNQCKDAKTLFAAIQTRFGGNKATKKTQKTLLKQMYENFSAPSTESLDSIFNRL
ncbi:hypothetical protein Tco_0722982 [Tanacetum coccineum]